MAVGEVRRANMVAFGQLIKRQRERRGIEQSDLAIALNIAQSTLSKYEAGGSKYPLDPDMMAELSSRLNVSQAELLAAMGYEVIASDMAAESIGRLIEAMPLTEIIAIKYGDGVPDDLIEDWEETAIRRAAKARQAAQKGSGVEESQSQPQSNEVASPQSSRTPRRNGRRLVADDKQGVE